MTPTPVHPVPSIDCFTQAQVDATRPHPNKKKIFVFCDGTGNQFADRHGEPDANSNVVKLYITLRVTNKQVAYYHPGVGTMGDPTIRHRIPRFWSKVKGLAFGAGFKDNVIDAYRYLMAVYNDGDEIYIFGFSRGAYTARAVAGMLHGYGLLCQGNERHVEYVWNMFHDAVKKSRRKLKENALLRNFDGNGHSIKRNFAFAETYSRRVTIRFMGIWDTVSSVGWIYSPLRLLDMAQNPSIQVGRHAVSIDERRAFYRDNLWGPTVGINHKEWPDELREAGISQDLAQVWFPGVHSDVGGSYPQWEAVPANTALEWMIGELKLQGAELCEERIAMVLGRKVEHYSADKIFYPPPGEHHKLHDSLTGIWWFLQCLPQEYYDKENKKIQWRVPYRTPRSLPNGAIIHESAISRMDNKPAKEPPYGPPNIVRSWCIPFSAPPVDTTANLQGCYVYQIPLGASLKMKGNVERYAKLVLGWVTFFLFWGLIGAILWYLVGLAITIGLFLLKLFDHTPGIHRLFTLL